MRVTGLLTLLAILAVALAGCVVAPLPYYGPYYYREHYRPYGYGRYQPGYYRHRYYPGYYSGD